MFHYFDDDVDFVFVPNDTCKLNYIVALGYLAEYSELPCFCNSIQMRIFDLYFNEIALRISIHSNEPGLISVVVIVIVVECCCCCYILCCFLLANTFGPNRFQEQKRVTGFHFL